MSAENEDLNVLVARECSGRVRDAFLRLGCAAWSCDLEPDDSAGGDRHIRGDVLDVLDGPPGGGKWDIMIAHPPCTYLSASGFHWTVRGLRDPQLTVEAIEFAETLYFSDIPYICIENPVGVLSTRSKMGKPSQIIQPYMFGDNASKRTCFWLKNLPKLKIDPAQRCPGRMVEWPKGSGKMVERWANQMDSGQNIVGPSKNRSKTRSRTYAGIAIAMAKQWFDYVSDLKKRRGAE